MPVSIDGGTTYRWHPGLYLSDSMSASPWVYPLTSQTYVGIAYSQYNCRDTVHAYVIVSPNAEILIPDSATLYPGESYQIPTHTNCTSFAWFPPSGLSSASVSSPVATPEISTKYIVTATNEYGCKTSDSISITVSTETLLDVPNAFAPGNGPNNTFKLVKKGIAKLNYFRIFNRWGNKVYESTDIDAGWDGTYKGVAQPYDVYVYEVEAVTSAGRTFTKAGNITLIR
jgi:gliding motility-associated-like protein